MCHTTDKQMHVVSLVSSMDLGSAVVLKCQEG